ncbi:MAG: hypothetical protein C4317_09415, partial [Acidimicrobiia bacterium]
NTLVACPNTAGLGRDTPSNEKGVMPATQPDAKNTKDNARAATARLGITFTHKTFSFLASMANSRWTIADTPQVLWGYIDALSTR